MPVVFDDVRKLATIEEVTEVRPIPDADAIEVVAVRGWTVVVKKGEFTVGDRVVYFEEDTALPLDDPRFAFLESRGFRDDLGERFHVLKIARLRGVYSQGLVLPLADFMGDLRVASLDRFGEGPDDFQVNVGDDITATLDLGKWEPPLPVGNGDTAGAFLTKYVRKTDSERVQNLTAVWDTVLTHEWDATEKVDGTSCTVVRDEDGNLRAMGRNWEIREGDNTYWNVVKRFNDLFATLEAGDGVQFEIAGPGIQANRLALHDVRPFVFDVVRKGVMVPRADWPEVALKWSAPVIDIKVEGTPEELVAKVDGLKSVITPGRLTEGVVFHTVNGEVVPEVGNRNTFKVISQKFLLKG